MVQIWYMDKSQDDLRYPCGLEPSLQQLCQLGIDIITIHKNKLPDYEEKVKIKDVFLGAFALGCKICYSLDDSGYYYERDKEDSWIQMGTTSLEIKRCLLLGKKNCVTAVWMFVEEPLWTAYSRSADHVHAQGQYMKLLAQAARGASWVLLHSLERS
ncbi:hypothetical protein AB1E18_015508 [Capra hircus]